MDREAIVRFYQVVMPYVIVLLTVLCASLVIHRYRYLKRSGSSFLLIKVVTSIRSVLGQAVTFVQGSASRMTKIVMPIRPGRTPGILRRPLVSNPALQTFLVENFKALESLVHFATTLLFFLSGVGRFRTLLFLSAYFLLRGVFLLGKLNNGMLILITPPALLVLFFQDIMQGQVFPLFLSINPFVFLLGFAAFLYLDKLLTRRIQNEVSALSGQHLFSVCPRCKYDNVDLVETCFKCEFQDGMPLPQRERDGADMSPPSHGILEEREYYKKMGLGDPLPQKALEFVDLDLGEFFLMTYEAHFGKCQVLINGSKELVKHIVFSTHKITLLHYHFDREGWRIRQVIPYDHIVDLSGQMKQVFLKKWPTLSIKTDEDAYELSFLPGDSTTKKIMTIVSCIRKRAIKLVNANIDFPGSIDVLSDLSGMGDIDVKDIFKSPWGK